MFIIIIILYCSMRLKLFNSLNANYQVSSYHNVYLLLKVCTLYRIEKIVNANRWWKINFSIFIFWVMADCVNNLPIKKRVVQKWPNLQDWSPIPIIWWIFAGSSHWFIMQVKTFLSIQSPSVAPHLQTVQILLKKNLRRNIYH